MILKEISILQRKIALIPRGKEALQGLAVGEKLSYSFYDGLYQGTPLLFLVPRGENPTPQACRITADRISAQFDRPVVFILKQGPTYERRRLIDKGVYFVMSDRYAYLPMLVALEKNGHSRKAVKLTPVAQYLLLYHLQVRSLEGLSAHEIVDLVPYSYPSTTLGITCLNDLELCQKKRQENRKKLLHFKWKGWELWQKAQPFLVSPLQKSFYCDSLHVEADYPICSLNALAHYTRINPEPERMLMLTDKEYSSLKALEAFDNPNMYDGDIMLEVWKYPAVGLMSEKVSQVDRLSLALALQTDHDPRVEKEVERMIKEMAWKD